MRTARIIMNSLTVPAAAPSRARALSAWQAAALSLATIAALYIGIAMEKQLPITRYTEVLGAIPVIICTLLVMRYSAPAPLLIRRPWRLLLLPLPFLPLLFADYAFPALGRDQTDAWIYVIVQSVAIGVTEELTFRYSLHRLWSQYGAAVYVVGSAALFGLLHYPLGMQVSIIAAVIGLLFALSRAAGMRLFVLILLHAFYDGPSVFRAISPPI